MSVATAGIGQSFADITEHARECGFPDCTHTSEIGCAVLRALEDGEPTQERYQNFLKNVKEDHYNQHSYVDKRKKDKQFRKMIKSAMKQLKKN